MQIALSIIALSVITVCSSTVAVADVVNDLKQLAEKSPYYSGKLADKKAPKGAMISDAMHQSIIDPEEKQGSYAFDKVTHDHVAPGVDSFNLGTIVNVHIVETKNGIVVYDTGDNLEEGHHFYSEIRKVTDKPIKAIMYSHEHYTGGSQAMVDEEAKRGNTDIKIIGHWKLMDSLAESGAGAALHKEVSDALAPRVIQQFYTLTPESGPGAAGHTHTIDVTGEKKIAPVNTPIKKDGQKITIDGRKFVFYIDDITTDTAQQLMVSIPDQGIVLQNIVWGFFPNIYSIRGGEYRNPAIWIKALDKLESLNPKILLGTHIKSTADHDEAISRIQTYQDAISSVLNQTLFEMIKGVQREKAAYEVELPKQVIDQPHVRQNYGEVVTMVPQIYSAVLGSFNGVAADAVPMHPSAGADMIVRGMGGQKATLKFAEGEFSKGNFLNAVRLGKHLVNYDSKNQANIDFQVKALRAMAGATESHNLRSWYLSQAIILNGDAALPGAFPVAPEIMAVKAADFADNFRIRLNHKRAGDTRTKIGFKFDKEVVGIEIRNGVAYTRDTIDDAEVVIKMHDVAFAKLYNNTDTIDQMVQAGEATMSVGKLSRASELLSMFDIAYDWQNDEGLQFLMKLMSKAPENAQ